MMDSVKDAALKKINKYKGLIIDNDFGGFYEKVRKECGLYETVSDITQLFIDAGIIDEVLQNLTVIPEAMFYETDIKDININNNIIEIGDCAFDSCTELETIILSDNLKTIGNGAFNYCYSITSITFPDTLEKILYRAFEDCRSLSKINIPDSVTKIDTYAFNGCSGLTGVKIPSRFKPNLKEIFGEHYSKINFTFIWGE